MEKLYPAYLRVLVVGLFLFFFVGLPTILNAQINFTQSNLNFDGNGNVSSGVTSLMYGPDGRLYVAEYPGTIKILTIQRNGQNNYVVTSVESLSGVTDIVNHDDDGTMNSGQTQRETTGLTVSGTAVNPIIYVTSSDFRIGAGYSNGDLDLDTNSGVITRLTWNGNSWDVVDIVRGLPRSEENHATNGLEFVNINGTDHLIVTNGGNTNGGGPSERFAYVSEYALSGAILSVNLGALNGLGVNTDSNGRDYIYDIPTLDDPSRANVNGITDPDTPGYNGVDVNDPFGGNDGLNQAMVVPSGPVQVLSPGYRNAYDLVVTESGALYVTDNGANGGWGGFPVNEGGGSVTNDYDPAEPGSSSSSGGEQVNNKDHLQLITTDLLNYSFGSFYGGHPNPIRANPNGAGLYTAPARFGTVGAVFRTMIYDPDGSIPGSTTDPNIGLPANWPPVPTANGIEGDWRGPGISNPDGPDDNPTTTWGTNTNGIDEYTASNFAGAMQGDLLAGHNGGNIRRVELNTNGTLQQLTANFLSGIGGDALGITCNSDEDNFPGTIWAGTLNGKIVVFEPQDFGSGTPPIIVQQIPDLDRSTNTVDEGFDLDNFFDDDNGTANLTYTVQLNTNPAIGASITGNILTLSYPSSPEVSNITIRATDADNNFVEQTFAVTVTDGTPIVVQQILDLVRIINAVDEDFNLDNFFDDDNGTANLTYSVELNTNPAIGASITGNILTLSYPSSPEVSNITIRATDADTKFVEQTFAVTVVDNSIVLYRVNTGGAAINAIDGGLDWEADGTSNISPYLVEAGTNNTFPSSSMPVDGSVNQTTTPLGIFASERYDNVPDAPDMSYSFPVVQSGNYEIRLYMGNSFSGTSQPGERIFDVEIEGVQFPDLSSIDLSGTYGHQIGTVITHILNITDGSIDIKFLHGIVENPLINAVEILATPTNEAPIAVASATPMNGDAPLEVTFTGGNSTDDVAVVSYLWDFKDGSPTSTMANPVHTFAVANTYLVELTVEDFEGLTNTSTVTIVVNAPTNEAPVAVATASPMSGEAPLEVTFTGSNSTDDVAVVSYLWDFKDGSPTSTVADPVHIFMAANAYPVELTVEDGEGLTNTSTVTIVVNSSTNEAPVAVANASPMNGGAPLEVTFTGSNSTDDVGVVSYLWDFKDGSPTSTSANPVHTFTMANTYLVELTVEDGEGLTNTSTVTIVVNVSTNEAPVAVASATPMSGDVPLEVTFTGSNSTDDVGVVSYLWDFKDGSPTSTSANPVHTFMAANTYPVELTVEDGEGLTNTSTVTIVVNAPTNEAPVAVASATPLNGDAPLEVTFTGSNSTDDVAVVSYLWDFKDGSPTSTEMDPSYIFNDAGVYEVSLTVADAEGLDNTNTVTVIVGEEGVVDNDITAILFVNPAKEVAQVQIIDMGPGNRTVAKVHLHDSSGRLLGLYNPHEIFRHGLYEIPVSTLSNGSLYFIGFEMSRGDHIVLKLVVKN
jgi:PKD repeat protein